MSTGTTIRDLRKQHRLSQTELAKAVHVSQATVTAWETGKAEPSSSALNTLASYFNIYLAARNQKTKQPTLQTKIQSLPTKVGRFHRKIWSI